jgi:hypothetical protein
MILRPLNDPLSGFLYVRTPSFKRMSLHGTFATCRRTVNERGRQLRGLRWLLGIYVQDVEGVLELVHNLHAPLPIWLELAVQTLQRPASHDGRFVPGSVFIRQFLTHEIEFSTVVVDMEKVPWHGKESRDAGTSSSRVSIAQIPPVRQP